jgi:hypothetical protein
MYLSEIETEIKGIPCTAVLTNFYHQPPAQSRWLVDNPDDYYGYYDIEFVILNRHKKRSKLLEKLMDKHDIDRIEQLFINEYNNQEEYYD